LSFDQAFLDRLRDAVPLAQVVGRRVRLVRRGREHSGLCPFHNEKSPSFTVNEDKGFFHCFGCGAHGDVIGFVMRSEGLGFPEAVERLAAEAGLALPQADPVTRAQERQRASVADALEAACAWFEAQLASPAGAQARDYLSRRGLSAETVAAFRLGFAPDRRGALRQALNARGVGDDLLVAGGLLKRADDGDLRDYFFGRVIFPIADRRGRVIAFGGRSLDPQARAKYLNSPDTKLFHKGQVLFNLDKARRAAHEGAPLLVVEGYMDVIALAQAGYPAAVAPLGTALTEAQIGELWRMAPEPLLCFDGDVAGQRAAARAVERALPLLQPAKSLRFVLLPAGEDPDSLIRSAGPQAIGQCIAAAKPLSEMLWSGVAAAHHLDTPERRAGLREALLRAVSRIADKGVQTAYRADMLDRYFTLVGGRRGRKAGPAAPVARVRPPAVHGHRRAAEVLMAMLIFYPQVAVDHLEEVAAAPLPGGDLDLLRRRIIDCLAATPDLDSAALECHLSAHGDEELVRALKQRVLLDEPLAKPETALPLIRKRLAYWIRRVVNLPSAEATATLTYDDSHRANYVARVDDLT